MTKDAPVDMRQALLDISLALAARHGIEGVSLRAVAAEAGRSTTMIFQHFGSKEGLLLATLDHAIACCRERHAALATTLAHVPQDAGTLQGVVAFYLLSESRDPATRLCLDALFRRERSAEAIALLRAWDDMRRAFWGRILGAGRFALLADFITTYSATELAFAAALHDEPTYALLLREALAGIFDRDGGGRDAAEAPATAWAEQCAFPQPVSAAPTPAMEAVLDLAVQAVIEHGPEGLNPRRLATEAGIAPSLIVYHYGDFAAFNRAAVLQAIMHGLPRYLDRNQTGAPVDDGDDDAWLSELARWTRGGDAPGSAGFYVHYARTLGQLGLLARRHAEYLPLLLQLRAIEGVGIQRASQSNWPRGHHLARAAAAGFAIWMKGRAILNDGLAIRAAEPAQRQAILAALRWLIPQDISAEN